MPGRLSFLSVLPATLLALGSCASAPTPMLPPELRDDEGEVGLDRVSLWPPGALDGYTRRLRLTLNPGLIRSRAAIRIDTTRTGHVSGYMITQRPDSHGHIITRKR